MIRKYTENNEDAIIEPTHEIINITSEIVVIRIFLSFSSSKIDLYDKINVSCFLPEKKVGQQEKKKKSNSEDIDAKLKKSVISANANSDKRDVIFTTNIPLASIPRLSKKEKHYLIKNEIAQKRKSLIAAKNSIWDYYAGISNQSLTDIFVKPIDVNEFTTSVSNDESKFLTYVKLGIKNAVNEYPSDSYTIIKKLEETKRIACHVDLEIPIKVIDRNEINVIVKCYTGEKVDNTSTASFSFVESISIFKKKCKGIHVNVNKTFGRNSYHFSVDKFDDKIASINVYTQSIHFDNVFKFYNKFEFKGDNCDFTINAINNIECVRLIPVYSQSGIESIYYKDAIVGNAETENKNIVILPKTFGDDRVAIEIKNIPSEYHTIALYRRNCTESVESQFEMISSLDSGEDNDSVLINDIDPLVGKFAEYYAECYKTENGHKKSIYSKPVIVSTTLKRHDNPQISVNVSKPELNYQNGTVDVSFTIETIVPPAENKKLSDSIKSQIPEIYDLFLDPLSNSSSPLSKNEGIIDFGKIFNHEVIRIDLETGDRQSFGLVSDGQFIDDDTARTRAGVTNPVPGNRYRYQIFTYGKNPIEVFKNYIATIIIGGKEINYLPYKWKNPKAIMGYLYPDDEQGIPIIDTVESLKDNQFGLTSQVDISGIVDIFDVSNVKMNLVDKNNAKIVWEITGPEKLIAFSPYNCYIVIREVNGIKRIMGLTNKEYYIDDVSEIIGDTRYMIIPITNDGFFDRNVVSSVYRLE